MLIALQQAAEQQRLTIKAGNAKGELYWLVYDGFEYLGNVMQNGESFESAPAAGAEQPEGRNPVTLALEATSRYRMAQYHAERKTTD